MIRARRRDVGRVGSWLAGIAVSLACAACSGESKSPGRPLPAAPSARASRPFRGMGTEGSLILCTADARIADEGLQVVTSRLAALEQRFSIFVPESDLARLNAAAGGPGVAISSETAELLAMGIRAARESGGAFDMTIGPLMALWGFRGGPTPAVPPSTEARTAALNRVGIDHLTVSGLTASLDREGVRLDAGGVAKGWAVDRCWEDLRALRGEAFLLNLGGNMRVSGRPSPDRPWSVGIRHPFRSGELLGRMPLADGMAVATSGHYERFVVIGGVRYAHIMDPRTGEPVRGMAGVTVLAPSAAEADVLSTTLFVLGMEEGVALLNRTGSRAEALFVPDRQPAEVWATPGIATLFEPEPGVVVHRLGWGN